MLHQIFCFLLIFPLFLVGCRSEISPKISWTLDGFEKVDSLNPILTPSPELQFEDPVSGKQVQWEERNVLNPSAVVKDGKVYLFYRAQDGPGTSRIGMAVSEDGLHFEKNPTPVFYPDNDSAQAYEWNYRKRNGEELPEDCKACLFDGVEDPRIVETEDGRYLMTYTTYDGKTARLAFATSKDLMNWNKHGLVFKAKKYRDVWSKSGSIVARQEGSKMIATKINGRYWMYFGDTNLFLGNSEDLLHWKVAEYDAGGSRIAVMYPRPGYFDSRLVEPGPHAMLREEGILLIYNSRNASEYGSSDLPALTYSAGQALFAKNHPYQLIDRTDSYFIHPDKPYELEGEVNQVCFVEGLVYFQEKWFLYYGTADSKIAVAVKDEIM